MIRVVHYGLGPIGAGIAQVIAGRADFQIVGGVDVDPAKVGNDVGTVIGLRRPLGVTVSSDAAAVLQTARPDVVVHATGSHLPQVGPQLLGILEAGVRVVSTCEELSYPFLGNPAMADRLDKAARDHGAAVVGTGINPGFSMDTLPLALTAVSQRVDSVRVLRVQDAARRRLPLQRKVGAGLTVEEFEHRAKEGTVRHVGLEESAYLIARGIGWALDRVTSAISPAVAERETRSSEITVPVGRVLGVQQVVRGFVGDRERITLELQMYLGAPDPHDHVVVDGVPRIDVRVNEGTHGDLATAAIVVNVIPRLLAAPPGLLTMPDLPVVHYQTPR